MACLPRPFLGRPPTYWVGIVLAYVDVMLFATVVTTPMSPGEAVEPIPVPWSCKLI